MALFTGKIMRWHLIVALWYMLSLMGSLVPTSTFGPEAAPITVYHHPFLKYLFTPTLITYYIVGIPVTASMDGMALNHLLALPLYFAAGFLLFKDFSPKKRVNGT
jgi:hypothetical protein